MNVTLTVPAPMIDERMRQIFGEGYTPEHDDAHDGGEMLRAAMIYFHHAVRPAEMRFNYRPRPPAGPPGWYKGPIAYDRLPMGWPWDAQWWKPVSPRRDLERAGALCLAEIDRLRRRDPARSVVHVEHKLALIIVAFEALPA